MSEQTPEQQTEPQVTTTNDEAQPAAVIPDPNPSQPLPDAPTGGPGDFAVDATADDDQAENTNATPTSDDGPQDVPQDPSSEDDINAANEPS